MIREVKEKGKKSFKTSFWKVVAVCFIVTFLTGGTTIYLVRNEYNNIDTKYEVSNTFTGKSNFEIINDFIASSKVLGSKIDNYMNGATRGVLATFSNNISKSNSFLFGVLNGLNQLLFKNKVANSIVIFIGSIISLVYFIFISNVIKVGKCRFLLENRCYKKTKIDRLLFSYKDKKYKNVALVMFKKSLYTFLWSLTIIGGIIKHYSYMFIPYILAENSDIKSKDAFMLSKNMTNGYKWKMFLLDLSFILYDLLGVLTFNIFNLLVTNPYKATTYTELYMKIRNDYIDNKKYLYDKLVLNNLNDKVCNLEYPGIVRDNKKIKIDKIEYDFLDVILLFFAISFIGYVWEVTLHLFSDGVFVNRGTLYGPILTIYGFGGVITLLLFNRYRDNPIKVFFLSMLVCGMIEYFSSWYMEMIYHTRWWDYTGYLFNVNGRVCLEGLLVFGFGCTINIYLVSPFLVKKFHTIKRKYLQVISIVLIIALCIDFSFYLIRPNQGEGISTGTTTGIYNN